MCSLTSVKLKILEFAHHFFHDIVNIRLEFGNFVFSVIFFQIAEDLLHVGLEVSGKSLLVSESSLDKSVVQNNVDSINTVRE